MARAQDMRLHSKSELDKFHHTKVSYCKGVSFSRTTGLMHKTRRTIYIGGGRRKPREGGGTSGRHLEGNGPTEQGQGGLLRGEGGQEKGRHTSPPLVIAAEGVCRR
jgi:hypothetical protein